MKPKIKTYAIGIVTFIISFFLCFIVTNLVCAFADFLHPGQSDLLAILFFTLTFFTPIIISFLIARLIIRWYERRQGIKVNWLPRNKLVLSSIISLYLLTLYIGNPVVQSSNTKWAIDEYKRINTGDNVRVWESHPYIKTFVSIPIAPFVVMSYHEYQLDGLYGFGGWDIQVWYLTGVKRILILPLWVS